MWEIIHLSTAYFLQNIPDKNYYNPTMHTRVTATHVGGPFLWHTVLIYTHSNMSSVIPSLSQKVSDQNRSTFSRQLVLSFSNDCKPGGRRLRKATWIEKFPSSQIYKQLNMMACYTILMHEWSSCLIIQTYLDINKHSSAGDRNKKSLLTQYTIS